MQDLNFKIRLDLNSFNSAVSKVEDAFEEMEKKFEGIAKVGNKLKDVGGTLTDKVTKPILAIGTASTAAAVESDSAFTRIKASLGLTDKEANKVMTSVRNLAKKGFDFGEATEAIVAVKQSLGNLLSPDEIEDFTAEILSMSTALGVDTQDSIRAASSMMRNFKISGQEATDIIAYGLQNGLDVSGDFLDTLHEYAPQMSALGFTAEQTLSIISQGMKDGAFNTDKLMDGLKESRLRLSEMSDDAKDAINSIGLKSSTVQKNIAAGGEKASKQMVEVAKKILAIEDPVKRNTVATAIFGTMWEDTGESMLTAIANGSGELEGLAGTADSVANTVENGLSAKIKALWNHIKELSASIGEVLVPILSDMAKELTPIINNVIKWVKENPELTKTIIAIAGAAAALGPILSTIGGAITTTSSLMTIMGTIGTGSLAPALAALGPVIAAVAAVLATVLIAKIGDSNDAIYKMQDKFGTFGYFLGGICEFISGAVQRSFGGLLITIETTLEVMQAVISGRFKDIPEIVKKGTAKMELNMQESADKMCLTATRGMDNLRNATDKQLKGTVKSMETILDSVPNIVDGKYRTAANKLGSQLSGMDKQQISILQGMNDTTRMMFNGIKEGMTVEEASKKVEQNLKTMAKAGKIDAETMKKDVTAAMDLMKQNMDTKTKEAANKVDANTKQAEQKADTNTKNLANKVDTNTKNASTKADTNTKNLSTKVDTNTKNASTKADTNTKNMATKVDTNTKSAEQKADTNTKNLSTKVDSNTKSAATKADTNTKNLSTKVDTNTRNAATKADSNTKNLSTKVDTNTRNAATKADSNLKNAATYVNNNTKNMATNAATNTAKVASSTDENFKKANRSIQQGATDMYNGAKNSYTKLADTAKQSATNMYNGVKTSADKMASSARTSASNMYNGVTTSTNSMANKAINDWNRVRTAYSKTITGKIQVTKTETTIKKTQKALAQSMDNLVTAINSNGSFSTGAISRNAVATTNNSVSINFNGSYSFRDRNDMDYFMGEMGKRLKRKF